MFGNSLADGVVALDVATSIREAYNSGAVGLAVLIGVASVIFPYVYLTLLPY